VVEEEARKDSEVVPYVVKALKKDLSLLKFKICTPMTNFLTLLTAGYALQLIGSVSGGGWWGQWSGSSSYYSDLNIALVTPDVR
jgi:hypothetical protein